MERECPRCRATVTDDRLLRCPSCRSFFTPLGISLAPEQEEEIYRRLIRRLKAYVFGSFSLLTLISSILMFDSLKSIYDRSVRFANGLVVERIDRDFREPRITQIVETVAADKAKDLLKTQVEPEVERFQHQTDQSLQKLDKLTDDLDLKYKTEYDQLSRDLSNVATRSAEASRLTQDLGAKVALLDKQNREASTLIGSLSSAVQDLDRRKTLYDLSVKAIADGDRKALTALVHAAGQDDVLLREIAISEVQRIKAYWIGVSTTKAITKLIKDKREIAVDQLTTCDLRDALIKSEDYKVRAVCAKQLAGRRERGVPEALAGAIERDQHLEVVRDATLSWQSVTGLTLPDVFGPSESVEALWKESGDSVNRSLADGASCNVHPFDPQRVKFNVPGAPFKK